MIALSALLVLAAIAASHPAGAPAGQSSQATSEAVAPLAAGVFHTCAVVGNANVRCWGFSGDGQVGYGDSNTIGDDETPGAAGPANLGAGRTVKAIAAGEYHTCAVLDNGDVRCWGFAYEGQLGYGNRNNIGDNETPGSLGPVDLGAGRTATAISAAGRHTCAVLDGGDVRCWGLNDVGQLGYGNTTMIGDNETPGSVGPVNFGPGRTAKAISTGGRHTCAILDDGSVRCWGLGSNGQLGYGDTNAVQDPSLVGSVNLAGRTAKAITAGGSHTCAVLDDGSVRCWGLADTGQLGYGNTNVIGDNESPGSVGPVALGSGRTAVAISAGDADTCAVLDDGSVRCWGLSDTGQLGYANKNTIGDNESPDAVVPVNVGTGRTAVAVAAGRAQTCARLDDGSVRCWGSAVSGRLGYCNTDDIGDDEAPGSVGPVDLNAPGSRCAPPAGGTTPGTGGPQTVTGGSVEPAPPPRRGGGVDPRVAEARRARELRACLAGAKRKARRERDSARRACLKRYRRTPGRVRGLKARAASTTTIVLSFTATGSDGARPPAARAYLVKQSLGRGRNARSLTKARSLCKGSCRFSVSRLGMTVTLTVTGLRPRTTYYYEVAARDNVSERLGPRSETVRVTTR